MFSRTCQSEKLVNPFLSLWQTLHCEGEWNGNESLRIVSTRMRTTSLQTLNRFCQLQRDSTAKAIFYAFLPFEAGAARRGAVFWSTYNCLLKQLAYTRTH
jgi:hypothetical protein